MQDRQSTTIREQIIHDQASGLSLQFEVAPNGETVLHVFGDGLANGNRTFEFDHRGELAGRGCTVSGDCRPGWMIEL